ncbi:alcohol oxidase [Pleurotus eryngii]|uniref:Alcohol oxidase n=1 Tax=Pleurotus eryngii TaxID=5323 RepID=A0A9P6A477_PLEER|nr:alcohol oxidase [Pleurotus eryngii]
MITVDYLVVGGGLAGLVVATRLAEDLDVVVGVLEAGQDMSRNQDVQTPANYYKGIRNPETDWGFFTAPQDGLNGRRIYLPRGKGLGGSTLLNLMQLGRASTVEYNAFEQLGSKGWDWPEFLKYFKKSEAFHPDSEDITEFGLNVADEVHGKSGPLPKIMPPRVWPVHRRVIEAFISVGIPFNAEPNDGANAGCWTGTAAIHPGQHTRASSASAYYEPNRDKSNLIVVTGAYATRVLFDPKESGDLLATAVEYQKDGEIHFARATKEVILCTGSFKTPQLLELSGNAIMTTTISYLIADYVGVGDKKILDPLNIPVIIDLPGVGSNLQVLSHYHCMLLDLTSLPYRTICGAHLRVSWIPNSSRTMSSAIHLTSTQYDDADGHTVVPPMSAFAFIPLGLIPHDGKILDDANKLDFSGDPGASAGMQRAFQMQKEWLMNRDISFLEYVPGLTIPVGNSHESTRLATISSYLPNIKALPIEGRNYLSFVLGLLHPFSRGHVHIRSSDPFDSPIIDPRCLNNATDIELFIDAVKLVRKVVNARCIKSAIVREMAPGPAVQFDAEIVDYLKGNVQTIYHPIGTAPMFTREEGGVVDESLKMYGTGNLRVVDASVIPLQISAHIQHTTFAIAEKAADIIKGAR